MTARLRASLAGFGLIEALVALVVISVGMIGIAALFTVGLATGRAALTRTAAVTLASAMAESIRGNRLGGAAYAGPARDNGCGPAGGVDCAPAALAAHDLWIWQRAIERALPAGAGVVRFAPGAPPTYTIEVSWDEAGVGPVTHTLVARVPER